MIVQNEFDNVAVTRGFLYGRNNNPFTRSTGQVVSRIYERLTKASRRRDVYEEGFEHAYRAGVYDAFKTLQKELNDKLS